MSKHPPFRWNITRREQLGTLLEGDLPEVYPAFYTDLREITADICAISGTSSIVFVGRSLEHAFDYLLGILDGAGALTSPRLLQFSAPALNVEQLAKQHPEALEALAHYVSDLQLSPKALVKASEPVVFTDIVASGTTFMSIISLLQHWSSIEKQDFAAVLKKLSMLGLTRRTKNSPHTQRWWQSAPWAELPSPPKVKSLSIEPRFWNFVGNTDGHTTPSHRLHRWQEEDNHSPERKEHRLAALRLSRVVFELGQQPEERKNFLSKVATRNERLAGRWGKLISVGNRS